MPCHARGKRNLAKPWKGLLAELEIGPFMGDWACKMGCDEPGKNRPKVPQKLGEFKWALGPIKRIKKIKDKSMIKI